MSKTKSKNSNKILEDHDGTFFCVKCGQAGFKSIFQGYGHLPQCKGYKAVVALAKREVQEMDEAIKNIEPKQFDEPKNLSVVDTPTLDFLDEANTAKEGVRTLGSGGRVGGRLGGSLTPSENSLQIQKLIIENSFLKASLKKTNQIAFNHNQHFKQPPQRKNFSGPSDIVNQSFGSIFELPAVRVLASIVAFVVFWNYAREQFDKLDRKRK